MVVVAVITVAVKVVVEVVVIVVIEAVVVSGGGHRIVTVALHVFLYELLCFIDLSYYITTPESNFLFF